MVATHVFVVASWDLSPKAPEVEVGMIMTARERTSLEKVHVDLH